MISVRMQSIVIFLILCNFLIHADLLQINTNSNETHVITESEEKNPTSGVINENLLHSTKITETKNVDETSTVTDNPAKPSTDKFAHLSQQTQSTSVVKKEPEHTTTTTTSATATTTTATTTTTKTTTPTTYKMYKEPLTLLSRTEIKNVQETQTTNKNTLNQSTSENSPPTHPQLNSVGRKENNDVIITNRDENAYSKPLPLLYNTARQNIHEVNVHSGEPVEKKASSSLNPKYHSGEEIKDDDITTKTTSNSFTESPLVKKISIKESPQYHSGEEIAKEHDLENCKPCCSDDETTCDQCCIIVPHLSEALLKSSV